MLLTAYEICQAFQRKMWMLIVADLLVPLKHREGNVEQNKRISTSRSENQPRVISDGLKGLIQIHTRSKLTILFNKTQHNTVDYAFHPLSIDSSHSGPAERMKHGQICT